MSISDIITNINEAQAIEFLEIDHLSEKALAAADNFRQFNAHQVDTILAQVFNHLRTDAASRAESQLEIDDIEALQYILCHIQTAGQRRESCADSWDYAAPAGPIANIDCHYGSPQALFQALLLALKTRNPIIFACNPRTHFLDSPVGAPNYSRYLIACVYQWACMAGAPENCIQSMTEPSMDGVNYLMTHPAISQLFIQGDARLIKKASQTAKPAMFRVKTAIPIVIDSTAEVQSVAAMLLATQNSPAIPRNALTLIVTKDIKNDLLTALSQHGCPCLNPDQRNMLIDFLYPKQDIHVHQAAMTQSAATLLNWSGITLQAHPSFILYEVTPEEIVKDTDLFNVQRPDCLIALAVVNNLNDGLRLAAQLCDSPYNVYRSVSKAAMFSQSETHISQFIQKIPCRELVINTPITNGVDPVTAMATEVQWLSTQKRIFGLKPTAGTTVYETREQTV